VASSGASPPRINRTLVRSTRRRRLEAQEQDDFYTFDIEHMEYLEMNYALVVEQEKEEFGAQHDGAADRCGPMPQELPGKAGVAGKGE
jgi:hypothetical protein